LRKPIPLRFSLDFSRSVDPSGEIFWGYVHGVVTTLSSKFDEIWTSFAQDLRFGAFVRGLSGSNRSDRSVKPV